MPVQTRFSTTINGDITSIATTCTLNAAPAFTAGFCTWERGTANEEDGYWANLSGLQLTGMLRGLSKTALTVTEVGGLKLPHLNGAVFEATLLHYIINNKPDLDENENVTGQWDFTQAPTTSDTPDSGNELANKTYVDTKVSLTGDESIAGIKTFDDDSARSTTTAAPVDDKSFANKKYVDDAVLAGPSGIFAKVTYGDTISVGNLIYEDQTDMTWKKITSTSSTWYKKLAIAQEAGVATDTNKSVLLEGRVSGLTFSNINPTFSKTQAGDSLITVGDAVGSSLASLLVFDNSSGAEAVIPASGYSIRARQSGTPSGAMQIYAVLEQQDQANTPACFRDTTSDVARGAIIASASIPQANFSGVLADLAFSFGSSVKIPAGAKVYLVVGKVGAVDASNFYVLGGQATQILNENTNTWSGSPQGGYVTISVTSTSPVGYGVKAYTGSDGSYGLTPTNPWSPVIGKVLSATEMYFDPKPSISSRNGAHGGGDAAGGYTGITTISCGFCPSYVDLVVSSTNLATTSAFFNMPALMRGDQHSGFSPLSNADSNGSDNFLGGISVNTTDPSSYSAAVLYLNADTGDTPPYEAQQNRLYLVRLETGFYVYNGFPSGTSFLSAGNAGFSTFKYTIYTRSFN